MEVIHNLIFDQNVQFKPLSYKIITFSQKISSFLTFLWYLLGGIFESLLIITKVYNCDIFWTKKTTFFRIFLSHPVIVKTNTFLFSRPIIESKVTQAYLWILTLNISRLGGIFEHYKCYCIHKKWIFNENLMSSCYCRYVYFNF